MSEYYGISRYRMDSEPKRITASGNTSLAVNETDVIVETASGAHVIYLPSVAECKGSIVNVRIASGSSATIKVVPKGWVTSTNEMGDSEDFPHSGGSTGGITTKCALYSNGAKWWRISVA